MTSNYASHLAPRTHLGSTSTTPQSAPARADQQLNHAGGHVFTLDVWAQLERFLLLGCDRGSYYASEKSMVIASALSVEGCLNLDGARAVARIAEVSEAGRAPKNDPAIFALAMAAAHDDTATRQAALAALPRVCRTGTHLFHFARAVEQFRGWGRALRRAVGEWYVNQPADRVAMQVAKYQQRDGWSHRDLLRLAHPMGATPQHEAIFRWVTGGGSASFANPTARGAEPRAEALPPMLFAFEQLARATHRDEVVRLVRQHDFTHEMVPTHFKNDPLVWEALLERMPMTAMLRNLAKMTQVGLLCDDNEHAREVARRLTDRDWLRAARIHPLTLLMTMGVYRTGSGKLGDLIWHPSGQVLEALEEAFYLAFDSIEPTGKRHLLALDVSASMEWCDIAGMVGITPRTASAAMAMATARVEPQCSFMGFSDELVSLAISPRDTLEEVTDEIDATPMGATDCALPMIWARTHRVEVDTFVIYTDNETWIGDVHPFQALRAYRDAMGIAAKLIVVGMTATKFTIADKHDPGMLDVVGFDTSAPAVMAEFARW